MGRQPTEEVPSTRDQTDPKSLNGAAGSAGPAPPQPPTECSAGRLLEALLADQFHRWQQGERVSVEEYLAGPAGNRLTPEDVLDLIYGEIALREKHGETPQPGEYAARFPEHRARLESRFAPPPPATPNDDKPTPPPSPLREGAVSLSTRSLETATDDGASASPTPDDADFRWNEDGRPDYPTIPGYEVLGFLGRGGMGVVYRARQVRPDRVVALKMIKAGGEATKEALARFRAEAEAAARLQHPNIVQVYEVGERDGLPFFSLEFVPGGSLAARLGGSPLAADPAARLTERLAWAMDAAHRRGIVHRDLKPANVLLAQADPAHGVPIAGEGRPPVPARGPAAEHYEPKITDFGLAKRLDADSGQTRTGQVMGTPSYMAPEQAQGRTDVGPAADIYALGAILYELLTGRPPFKAATLLETLELVRTQEPVPPSRLHPRLPRDLETICLKCLHKDPARRYATAAELAEDLQRFLGRLPIRARPVSALEHAVKWVKRRPTAAALAGVCLLTAVGVVVGLLVYQDYRWHEINKVRQWVDDARSANNLGNWEEGRNHAKSALDEIGTKPFLGSLWDSALRESQRAEENLKNQKSARRKFKEFTGRRDEALFRATGAHGEGLAANLRQTKEAAWAALKRAGISEQLGADQEPDSVLTAAEEQSLSKADRDTLQTGRYELLLVAADCAAAGLSDENEEQRRRQAGEALATLGRADEIDHRSGTEENGALGARVPASVGQDSDPDNIHSVRIGILTHGQGESATLPAGGFKGLAVYHLKRAEYLTALGRKKEAAEAQEAFRRAEDAGKDDPLDRYLTGAESFKQGDLARATPALELAAGRRREQFWPGYFLALCYLKREQYDLARAALDDCLRPGAPEQMTNWVLSLRGFAFAQVKRYQDAEKDFQVALKNRPDRYVRYALLNNLAVLYIGQQRFEEGIARLNEAVQLLPGRFHARVTLAKAYQQLNRLDDALRSLDQAIKNGEDPNNPDRPAPEVLAVLYRNRAWLHHKFAEQCQSASGAGAAFRAPGPLAGALLHLRARHGIHWALGDFNQALKLTDPDSRTLVEIHLGRARCLFAEERYEEAVAAYQAALQAALRPASDASVIATGVAFPAGGGGPLPTAAAFVGWMEPRYVEIYPRLAEAQLALKRYAEADASFTEYLNRGGKQRADVYRRRGWARVKLNRLLDAAGDYTRALELNPLDASLYEQRGRVYLAYREYESARRDFDEALRLNPDDTHAYHGRGFARVQLAKTDADLDAALKDAREAVRRGASDPTVLHHAARIYAQAAHHMGKTKGPRYLQNLAVVGAHRRRALDLLREALDRLRNEKERREFWQEQIDRDDAFDAMRNSLDFDSLAARYSANLRGRAGP